MSAEAKSWRTMGVGELFGRLNRRGPHDEVEPASSEPGLPGVNLLPDGIRQSIALAKLRRAGIVISLVILAVSGLVWAAQLPAIQDSQADLDAAQDRNTAQQAQVQALSPIAQMLAQIAQQEDLVSTTLASQPRASLVHRRLAAAAAAAGSPAMRFSTVTITYSGIPAAGTQGNTCPNPDPFATRSTIGCIVFSATAGTREQVSELLIALGKDSLFLGPYVNTSTISDQAGATQQSVNFSGTSGISLHGLAVALTREQVAALSVAPTAPPAPLPTPDSAGE